MRILEVHETGVSPRVILDKSYNIFEICGNSILPDTDKFYKPILEWLEDYKLQPNSKMELVFNLNYYNISSMKHIMYIVYKLKEIQDMGNSVNVVWHYSIYDDYMQEFGNDLAGLYEVDFTFTSYDVFDRKLAC